MMNDRSTIRQSRAFTLVETLVAIAILMIALVGPYYSIQEAILTSYVARDQLVASQLAQEGEEYIYFLRDSNYLSGASWLSGMNNCTSVHGCTVDPAMNTTTACPASGCKPLMQAPSGLYTQTGNYPATRFTRTVQITSLSTTEVQVNVTVNWITDNHAYSVSTNDDLYNWL